MKKQTKPPKIVNYILVDSDEPDDVFTTNVSSELEKHLLKYDEYDTQNIVIIFVYETGAIDYANLYDVVNFRPSLHSKYL